jgi:hypothetical protein
MTRFDPTLRLGMDPLDGGKLTFTLLAVKTVLGPNR